jgi:glycosyltransferase involved in cell wall biosynthesis
MSHKIEAMMPYYYDLADEIIIVDNNPKKRLFYDKKVKYLTKNKNIFVNPAWNWGAKEATGDYLIIANDDVIIPRLAELMTIFANSNYDIIGSDVRRCHVDKDIQIRPEFQMQWGWGCFMLMRKSAYYPIPEQFKIWFGDNILFLNNVRRGSFGGLQIITEMSETLRHGFMQQARSEEPLFKQWFNENYKSLHHQF